LAPWSPFGQSGIAKKVRPALGGEQSAPYEFNGFKTDPGPFHGFSTIATRTIEARHSG
jgi:hypothetical protein